MASTGPSIVEIRHLRSRIKFKKTRWLNARTRVNFPSLGTRGVKGRKKPLAQLKKWQAKEIRLLSLTRFVWLLFLSARSLESPSNSFGAVINDLVNRDTNFPKFPPAIVRINYPSSISIFARWMVQWLTDCECWVILEPRDVAVYIVERAISFECLFEFNWIYSMKFVLWNSHVLWNYMIIKQEKRKIVSLKAMNFRESLNLKIYIWI